MDQLSSIELIGFILAVVSTVLAVVSIVFSAIFFWWGKKQNDSTTHLTAKIEEKVVCLEKMFDKMYDSTYQSVRENNQAMQKSLFPGSFETQALENRDMDVYLLVADNSRITKENISKQLRLPYNQVSSIVDRMQEKGVVNLDDDGKTVVAIARNVGLSGSSGDGSGA